MLKGKQSLLLLFCTIVLHSFAQESVNSSGGDATGIGGSAAYSIGQIVYTSNSSSTGTIFQGVQQAYEIYAVGLIDGEQAVSVQVYPNPTSQFITLDFHDYFLSSYSVQLTDIQGKLIQEVEIIDKKTELNLSHLSTASYYLVLTQKNKVIKKFKIVKS
jgi:hypothetical protein